MPYRSALPNRHEIEVEDRFGEKRTIRQTRSYGGYQLKREAETPAQVLAKEAGVLIGQRVKRLRLERGWTLADLATRAGVRHNPKNRMWEIENAVRAAVSIGTVYALALALDVEATELLPSVDEVREFAAPTTVKQTVVAVR